MNTTKDIHLSHVKFTMDDEAYIILKSYLNKLTIAFSSNSSKNEILEDIESHIAELFSANSSINRVISVSDVNNAIDVLGTPEELAEDENEQDKPSKNTNTNKKLFRDTDDSYVGGVASGLAHYFGISPAWIRVLFILFFFLPVPFTTLAYIILWIVVPSAKTSADKIRMNGEAVSVASIKNKIESVLPEIEKEITDFDKEYAKGLWGKVKYYLKKTINVLLITSSKLLKIVSIIFGYILMFYSFLGGLITSLIVLFLGSVNSAITNSTSSEIVINGNTIYELNDLLRIDILDFVASIGVVSIVIFGLLILIPCVVLFIVGLKLAFRNSYNINKMTMYVLASIWIMSFMYFIYAIGVELVTEKFPYSL
ncbi:PspC domain-containing protein [Flavobacteriaceae bacterium]|jgi:phage shock protein PspC (stress-responsive transcriptional regulator)|nr:PspC domain-containing protein [Flavobacteriaceae bacterium]MDC1310261.1 PspC domain-containing protein [Flavobacteriaceae bacterium]